MNYTSLRANTVIPLLTKYGKPMTIVRAASTPTGYTKTFDGGLGCWKWTKISDGSVVYVDPTVPAPVSTTIATVGVEKPYKQDEIDGSVIVQGDRRFVLAGDVTPAVGDTLQVDSATDLVRIQDLQKIAPALITLAWVVHARE